MRRNERGTVGGFTGVNSGRIRDCYCVMKVAGGKENNVFVGQNSGNVSTSFFASPKNILEYWTRDNKLNVEKLESKKEAQNAGFNMDDIWTFSSEKKSSKILENNLKFIQEKWFLSNPIGDSKRVVRIKNEEQFIKFCDMVNSGDKRAIFANVILENDLDFKGKKIKSIGENRNNAYEGIFDGNNHAITNYEISSQQPSNKGLFGILKGEVYNLTLDCQIKGEGVLGALCAVNEGTIAYCGATVNEFGKGDKLIIGGLVGENIGNIYRCYVAGRIQFAIIPIIPMSIAVMCVFIIGILAFFAIPAAKDADKIYASIEDDPNQKRIEDEDATEVDDGKHKVAFTFDQLVHVNLTEGRCYLNFSNPSYDENKIVAKLMVENAAGELIVAGESKAVLPGYGVEYITLNEDGLKTINKSMDSGYIYIYPYDMDTEDKAMVESQLPVSMIIIQ